MNMERRFFLSTKANVFGFLVSICSFFLVGEVVQITYAHYLGKSSDLKNVLQAVTLDPRNPEIHEWMGLLREWGDGSSEEAVQQFKIATMLQPISADYWAHLGESCVLSGDSECAENSYKKAIALAPFTPKYRWAFAVFVLKNGGDGGLEQIRQYLKIAPDNRVAAFALCLRFFSPDEIWNRVILGNNYPKLPLEFIAYLADSGHLDSAAKIWNQFVVSEPRSFNFSDAEPLLDHLIDNRNWNQARKVWGDLKRLGVIRDIRADSEELIFNGGFEQKPLNGGFDWRYQPEDYLQANFSDAETFKGSGSFALEFTVESNNEFEPIYQIVPVTPSREYLLTAYDKSEDITSDSGPRLRVMEEDCATCQSMETENTTGTTPWHLVSLRFASGPKTEAIKISLWRPRSRVFPMEIHGRFWLDEVSLKAVTSVPQMAAKTP